MTRSTASRLLLPAALLSTALSSASCDDAISVKILDYDAEIDSYDFQTVEVETLDNVNRLEGRATHLVGGAVLELDYRTNMLTWVDPGYRVAFAAVRAGDVLVPEDFDSLAMVSIYYQIEQSLIYFEGVGFDSSRLVEMETYYWPKFTIFDTDGEKEIQKDNAFYLYASKHDRGFYVFPYDEFGWLPLSMNGGVMTHEYAHAVFDALVNVPNRAWIDGGGLDLAAANFLYGLNEGFADTIAVARLGDPNYMEHSIATGAYVASCNGAVSDVVRDASQRIVYTQSMDDRARDTPELEFCPYSVGSFVSSAMFATEQAMDGLDDDGEVSSRETRGEVAGAFVRALDALGESLPPDFELYDFFDAFVSQLESADSRAAACSALSDVYAMYYDRITGC